MLHEIRIASPRTADWEQMTGDDRTRHCARCNLVAYNFSAMTEIEIEQLIAASRCQRLCGPLYRRRGGSMLTRDWPVGFRAVVRRVSRVAGAALSVAIGVGFAVAQTPQNGPTLTQIAPAESGIVVVVVDETGPVIPKAQVFISDGKSGEVARGISSASGQYHAGSLTPDSYVLTVTVLAFELTRKPSRSSPMRQGMSGLNLGSAGGDGRDCNGIGDCRRTSAVDCSSGPPS